MATITISEQDVVAADAYLSAYLKEKIPEADFSQGSAIRDFVVKAIAHIFAFFRGEAQATRDRQSLLTLQTLEPSSEVDEAVDALLSNLFIGRKGSAAARVVATLHFTNRVDVTVAVGTRFFRSGQVFTIDSTSNVFISGSALRQVLLTTAGAAEYVTTVTLVCSSTGTVGNVTPGRFSGADRFNSFFSYAENLDYGLGGRDVETTSQLLARAPTALSVRNLVNVRSVEAVLLDKYPELTGILTAGFGDPEMTRDRASEGVTKIDMHVGGHMDVYVKLPSVAMTEDTYIIGAEATRADGVINIFKDTGLGIDFTAGPGVVVPGDVLKIQAGMTRSPREFLITEVLSANQLAVSTNEAFPEAATGLSYTIGALSPSFSDKRSGSVTGESTQVIQASKCIFLTGRPRGKIRKLEMRSDAGVTWTPLTRVNVLTPAAGEYTVVNLTPGLFQSDSAVEKVVFASSVSDGWPVRMTFDTLSGFDVVAAQVTDSFERNVCANNQVRGFIPVYLGVQGQYALSTGATAIDDATLKAALATFIYEWDTTKPLDVSAVTRFLRDTFPTINRFYEPTSLYFTAYTPDGQLYEFETPDVVTVFPDGKSGVHLRQLPDVLPPLTPGTGLLLRDESLLKGLRPDNPTEYASGLLQLQGMFANLGVTPRNIRFFPDPDLTSISVFLD